MFRFNFIFKKKFEKCLNGLWKISIWIIYKIFLKFSNYQFCCLLFKIKKETFQIFVLIPFITVTEESRYVTGTIATSVVIVVVVVKPTHTSANL